MIYPNYRIVSSNLKEPSQTEMPPKVNKHGIKWLLLGMALMYIPVLVLAMHQRETEKATMATSKAVNAVAGGVNANTKTLGQLVAVSQKVEKRLGMAITHSAVPPPVHR